MGSKCRALLGAVLGAMLAMGAWAAEVQAPAPWTQLALLARTAALPERPRVELPESDWQWLREKRTLVVGVAAPDYAPLIVTVSGSELEGVTADYLGLVSEALNVRIEMRRYPSRRQTIQALQDGEIDLIGRATGFEAEIPDLLLSRPYSLNQPVIVGQQDMRLEGDLQLAGRRLAVVGDYFSPKELADHFPDAEVVLTQPQFAEAPYPWAADQPRFSLQNAIEAAIAGTATPADALAQAQKETEDWLAKQPG